MGKKKSEVVSIRLNNDLLKKLNALVAHYNEERKNLLSKVKLDNSNSRGFYILEQATMYGKSEIIKMLIEKEYDGLALQGNFEFNSEFEISLSELELDFDLGSELDLDLDEKDTI